MVQFCIELAKKHLEPIEKDWQAKGDEAVGAIKEALDAKYGPAWAVLAGKRWGASITHDQNHFINFVMGKDLNVTVRGGRAPAAAAGRHASGGPCRQEGHTPWRGCAAFCLTHTHTPHTAPTDLPEDRLSARAPRARFLLFERRGRGEECVFPEGAG